MLRGVWLQAQYIAMVQSQVAADIAQLEHIHHKLANAGPASEFRVWHKAGTVRTPEDADELINANNDVWNILVNNGGSSRHHLAPNKDGS